MSSSPVYIFGEVLFDKFPHAEPLLGGAPFNVAWHLRGFGEIPRFISAVGQDAAGDRILAAMADWDMDIRYMSRDPLHPSGAVNVCFNDCEPHYTIEADSAYDHIQLQPWMFESLAELGQGMLYHGSLALRQAPNQASLDGIKKQFSGKLFIDVNLRAPWFSREVVLASLQGAHSVKMNFDELLQLSDSAEAKSSPSASGWLTMAATFRLQHNIVNLLITRGAEGATLLDGEGIAHSVVAPPLSAPLVDTVGAGDAFAAVALLGALHEWSLDTTLERAQQFASFIVTQQGAICTDPATYRDFQNFWGLTPVVQP
jgi:fructokinase